MAKKDDSKDTVTPDPAPAKIDTASFQVAERQPIDLEAEGFTGKFYVHKKNPKVRGQLKIDENGHFARTHIVKSQVHYWQGSEEAFKEEFEKE